MMAAGAAMGSSRVWAETEDISHTAESIHQETLIKTSRNKVFDALTNTSQFDKVIKIGSGMNTTALGNKPTAISGEPGGSFTIFGGTHCGSTNRTGPQRKDRAVLACRRLGPRDLLHCKVRPAGAGISDKNCF